MRIKSMAHLCWCASLAALLALAGGAAYSTGPDGKIVGLYDDPAYALDGYDGLGLWGGHWHDHDSWHDHWNQQLRVNKRIPWINRAGMGLHACCG
jgi:hypothetical protein